MATDLGWMANFEVKDAGDVTDLELVCTKCNEQVCALQAPDTMLMLVLRIGEHVCPKMHDHSITVDCHPECPRWEYVNERSEMPETAQAAEHPHDYGYYEEN